MDLIRKSNGILFYEIAKRSDKIQYKFKKRIMTNTIIFFRIKGD